MAKLQEIEELYQDTLKNIVSSPDEWKKFLRTASKVYRYNFNDQMLLHAQNPDVEAVATMDIWNTKMHCWVKRGAKGIALIDRNSKGKKRLKYVFDVESVHKEENIGKYPYLWVLGKEQENAVISGLESEYNIIFQNGIFAEGIRKIAEKLAEEEVTENFKYIKEAAKDSFLEDVTDDELKKCYRETLAESIEYSVLSRCEIDSEEFEDRFTFSNVHEFNSENILLLLGNSFSTHSEKLLLEIGKNVRDYNMKHNISENRLEKLQKEQYNQNNKKFKESNINEIGFQGGKINESRIYSERRVSDSESNIKGTTERTVEKMGEHSDGIYAGEQSSEVFPVGDPWGGQSQTFGDTEQSRGDVPQSGRKNEDERRSYGTVEKRESDGMGTSNQQYQTQSGGNRKRGSDLSDLDKDSNFVQMTLFSSFEEQSGNIAVAVAREEDTLDTATFSIPEETNIAEQVCMSLKMNDMHFTWNTEKNCISVTDELGNNWQGKEFYSFILTEAVDIENKETLLPVSKDIFEHFLYYAQKNGFELKADRTVKNSSLIPKINFHITDESLGRGTPREKYAANVTAIRLLKKIESENRLALPDEQITLSQYVGWGGLADVFDDKKQKYESEYKELKQLLTEEEYSAARSSTLNAHYTDPGIIKGIYDAINKMGFSTGNVLEPAMGIGNFFGMLPESMSNSHLYGVELDEISGRIAKKLYPNADITISGFEKTDYPDDFFDVAIGNVPFGDYQVNDKEYNNSNFLIHDYFFAKSLDKIRPGGVIAFVTSKGTLDKKDDSIRKYLAQRADLLGAVRLPNMAFKANAGTEVTSDIVFLQKRDGLSYEIPEWVSVSQNPEGILMNNYFISHPEMIVGEMRMVSGPFGLESACILDETELFYDKLNTALKNVQGEIQLNEMEIEREESERAIPAPPDVANFSYAVIDDNIFYRENSVMKLRDIPENQFDRVKSLINIRKCTYELIEYQLNDYSDEQISRQQKKLNTIYDDFTKKYGRISSKINAKYFEDDAGYPMVCSLELFEEEKYVGKADIFTKRTIQRAETVTSVDTASEALTVSIAEKGKVDIDYMCELTGAAKEDIITGLRGVIFKNPLTGKFETADEYLSGNVRSKLSVAEKFAKTDEFYQSNVNALKEVQPKDLNASEIDIRLGATWIGTEIITDFVRDILKPSEYMLRGKYIEIMYSEYTHEWRIKGKNFDSSNPLVNTTYGTNRINAYKILEDTLNLKDVRIFDKIDNPDGTTTRKLNQKETAVASQKQDALKEAFGEWVFKDRDRRVELCKKYNELFNSIRPREYLGENLKFPGMALDITLKPYQKNAVARQLYGPNTLLAHCVGAGKTFTMTAAAMESKRLGLCKKSLFVVPNHLIGDWANDFMRLYPGAKILAASKKDFSPAERKKFCSRIATGNWDAVIIGHSQFEKIPLSVERQEALIQAEIAEIQEAVRAVKYSNGDSFTIKQMEKQKKQLTVRLNKLHDSSKKDSVVTFEQLGVDRLFVDESHYYKNLYHHTKMRNVSGLSTSEAAKSSDIYAKCRYMDEITGGMGITFATGTPISNTMTEMYTNMKYLQSMKLEEMGMAYFDSWASTFGDTTTEMELAPEGTGYRLKTRFAKFHNIPELMNIFKECADVQTKDMLNLPIPEAEYVDVVLEPSDYQKEKIAELGKRADMIRSGAVDPKVDNMLKITNDGRCLALDERMLEPEMKDNGDNKATACADRAFKIWEETKEERSTQLIFSDISTPNKGGMFSIYEDVKQKLINKGVPKEEIAFIHDYDTEKKKTDLFSKVRKGQVRFLFGSTQKMGAGTNVQDKLIALHHLDVPWRPSDIEQQEGRILRQGNENDKVQIFRYIKKGTFDSYSWQLIEKKQRFISQIMTSKSPVRSAEDIDDATLNYAEVKALATGNPKIKEKMELDVEMQKLKLIRANFYNQKYHLEDSIAVSFPNKIAAFEERVKGFENDVNIAESYPEDNFTIQIADTVFQEKKDAGEALLAILTNLGQTPTFTTIGMYRGFDMSAAYDSLNGCYVMNLKGNISNKFHLSNDALGNITRIDNAVNSLPQKLEEAKLKLEQVKKEFEDAKIEVKKEFSRENEYQEKSRRLQELDKELNMDKNPKEQLKGLSIDEKMEKVGDNVSDCTIVAQEIEHISEERAESKTDKLEDSVQKSILERQHKDMREDKIEEIHTDVSKNILSKKVTELTDLKDETETYAIVPEEKPDLERGDIFEYEKRKWKVISNDGFMLSAENMNKNSSMPFINWIGRIKDHEYVLISKSEQNKEDKSRNKERKPEKQPAINGGKIM